MVARVASRPEESPRWWPPRRLPLRRPLGRRPVEIDWGTVEEVEEVEVGVVVPDEPPVEVVEEGGRHTEAIELEETVEPVDSIDREAAPEA